MTTQFSSAFGGQVSVGRDDGVDQFAQWVAGLPGTGQRANRSAMGSVGFFLKDSLKETVNGNTANWPRLSVATAAIIATPPSRSTPSTWSQDHRSRAQWEAIREGQRMAAALNFAAQFNRMRFWGALAALTVYQVAEDGASVVFGFLSGVFGTKAKKRTSVSQGTVKTMKTRVANEIREDIVTLARRLTDGDPERRIVTREMQNYLRSIGLFSPPVGAVIKLPARPLIGPHYLRVRDQIPAVYREKFWASFTRHMTSGEAWMASTSADQMAMGAA